MAINSSRHWDWMLPDNPLNVRVVVNRTVFILKKKDIVIQSRFFRNAFSDRFQEGKTSTLHLPETDADTFELFTTWMRTREISPFSSHRDQTPTLQTDNWSKAERTWDSAISRAYVFAHMYMVEDFAQALHDAFIKAHFSPCNDALSIFNCLPENATLYRLFDEVPEYAPICKAVSKAIMAFFNNQPDGDLMFHLHLPDSLKGRIMMLGR
ncbi:hypothetical protein IWX49DRAFT_590688 [Phyllosticta citricarpa]|uniref:BTB domain-containing protein n=2 Tax=Phyllosticta TaxID=121621 RepID=A0ABR1MRF6_9PEZI